MSALELYRLGARNRIGHNLVRNLVDIVDIVQDGIEVPRRFL
jgi:hypothetical protein